MTTARSLATQVLERIQRDGAYSHIALSSALNKSSLEDRDRALATELVYGTLTYQRTLDEILKRFVSRRLEKLDLYVLLTLRLAAYQLVFLDRVPDHAVVNEAVEMAKKRSGRGASGLVNGVLRAMLRKQQNWHVWENVDVERGAARFIGLRHSLPDWMARRLIETHGFERAQELAAAYNERPPLYFRPLTKAPKPLPEGLEPVDGVPDALKSEGMNAEIERALTDNVLVIQDIGSQLIGLFSAPEKGARVLDPCAGLGGKALHLAHQVGAKGRVVASDPQASKIELLEQTIAGTPLAKRIEVLRGEITELGEEHQDFDLVLVDAPCTGLGVIRRHPETRWRRNPDDIRKLAALQREILTEAASRVKKGGVLTYSVCTFTPEEGPEQIEAFLKAHPDFERAEPPKKPGINWSDFTDDKGDLHLTPLDHGADGFYAARLQRTT